MKNCKVSEIHVFLLFMEKLRWPSKIGGKAIFGEKVAR